MAITTYKWQLYDFDKTTGIPKQGTNYKISSDGGSTFLPSGAGIDTDVNGSAIILVTVAGAYDLYIDNSLSTDNQGISIIPLENNLIRCVDTDGSFGAKTIASSTGALALHSGKIVSTNDGTIKLKTEPNRTSVIIATASDGFRGGFNMNAGNASQLLLYNGAGTGTMTADGADGSIATAGTVRPMVDGTTPLGTGTFRWSEVHAVNGTIITSDENLKTESGSIPLALKNALKPLKARQYKYKDAVELKGSDKARWHYGYMAQDVEKRLKDAGLNPEEYAFLCKDELMKLEIVKKVITVDEVECIESKEFSIVFENGKHIKKEVIIKTPILQDVQVFNEDGEAIEGLFVSVEKIKSVTKTIDIEEYVGTGVTRYALRYDELNIVLKAINA